MQKYEAGALDDAAAVADTIKGYGARIAALERLVAERAAAGPPEQVRRGLVGSRAPVTTGTE